MTVQIALLRAINVGGRAKVAMADLRQAFADLGIPGAQSLLQTGNILFQCTGKEPRSLEAGIETGLADRLGLATDVVIRSADEWAELMDANPFPDDARNRPHHTLVMPLKTAPASDDLERLIRAISGRERVRAVRDQLYLVYPDGIGRSKLTAALIEAKLGTRGTARNWNTVLKIAKGVQRFDDNRLS